MTQKTQINAIKIKALRDYLNLIICVNLRHLRHLRASETVL